jgi:hypothetical protein
VPCAPDIPVPLPLLSQMRIFSPVEGGGGDDDDGGGDDVHFSAE